MSEMQRFFEIEIATDPTSPYYLLAQVSPETPIIDDLLEWFAW